MDKQTVTDVFVDEKNLSLSLVPVQETMLFSGIPDPEAKPIPEKQEHFKATTITVKNKKALKKNLSKFLKPDEALLVFDRVKSHLDFKIDENIKFLSDKEDRVIEINTFAKNLVQLNLRRNFNEDFVFYFVEAPTDTKVVRKRLKVQSSLSKTLKSAKIPKAIVDEYLHQLSYTIDFQRDVKNGDTLELLYEANFTKNDSIIGDPLLLYGLMHLNYHKIELFRYKLEDGKVDFFDASGKSLKKYLMRTPVKGARLSSKFGVRKHPILGFSKMHRGVDFAAKRGTPIMAAGDGRVTYAGRNGSFGRFVEIKHLNNFKTRYAHLYKYAKGIKKGRMIKQGEIIGYVGTSGRSTGPHLHYEVKHKNRTINPMKLKLDSTINIENNDMPNFYANVSLTRERFLATKLQESETAGVYE
ncbi:MAG: M23 family metallopeptidase [Alphaproteobacteria bacterium]